MSLQQVVSDLQHAADYLTAYGQAPNLTAYVKTLVQFYEGQLSSALRPAQAPTIAEILAANQGNLLASDPVLFPAVVN